jgi:hypothetical protein
MGKYFKGFTVDYIERNKNTEADDPAKVAARNIPMPTAVFFFKLLRMLQSKQSYWSPD